MLDVIIVGAGFAGVAAARELGLRGMRVLLLEGRPRIGGRTFRRTVDGQPFELGGSAIHWTQPHVWAEVSRYDLAVIRRPDSNVDHVLVVSEGQLHDLPAETAFETLSQAYAALYAVSPDPAALFPEPFNPLAHRLWEKVDHLSVEDQLRQIDLPRLHQDMLKAMLATDGSAVPEHVALTETLRLRALVGTDDGSKLAEVNGTYMFQEGTTGLLNAMLDDSGAEVKTSTTVRRIEQRRDDIRVMTQDGATYTAGAGIVAVPLNTLPRIAFDPPIAPAKHAAARERQAGGGVKLFIKVRGEFPGLLALAPPPSPLSMLTTSALATGATWLLGFGPAALFNIADADAVQAAVRQFLPEAEVIAVAGHDWNGDVYSLGTWCNFKPGQAAAFLGELIRPEGRLFFAGADIALGWRGYIDGAIETGVRAARHVLCLRREQQR